MSFVMPPHLASDFYLWLWWATETKESRFTVTIGCEEEEILVDVDSKISFRRPRETKVAVVMTGENPSSTPESRATLIGGKVIQDIALRLKRGDKEFAFMLKGNDILFKRLKLPTVVNERDDEEGTLYDRMYLYEECFMLVGKLFELFSTDRLSNRWRATLQDIQEWATE
jgi:hypothetical protein